jgi:hypothetical protein
LHPDLNIETVNVEELRSCEEAEVEGEQDGVRLVGCERCAEEDDEDEDGGDREGDSEDEREEGGLC